MNKAIIFDFDGTLVDSEKSILKCFKKITQQIIPNRVNILEKILIGPPLKETASLILGPDNRDRLDEFISKFIKMHDEQVTIHTKPYSNVKKILKKFHSHEIPMAIATNKRNLPTLQLIKYFGWEQYFSNIECSDNGSSFRNKTKIIKDIIDNDLRFKHGFFLGDTINDGISANSNDLKFIWARYGYGKNQNWRKVNIFDSINKFSELDFLLKKYS